MNPQAPITRRIERFMMVQRLPLSKVNPRHARRLLKPRADWRGDLNRPCNLAIPLKRMVAARGTTTLLVTHENRILDRANRILTLEDGRIVKTEDRVSNQDP